jgi:hypothetical protein
LTHQSARHAKVVGQFLLGQLGAGQNPVLHDGAGERFDDVVRGGYVNVSRSLCGAVPRCFVLVGLCCWWDTVYTVLGGFLVTFNRR